MKNLVTKERLCTLVTIAYHCLFLSGASFYLAEFQKTRDVIEKSVTRVEQESVKLRGKVHEMEQSVNGVTYQLEKVEKTCKRLF